MKTRPSGTDALKLAGLIETRSVDHASAGACDPPEAPRAYATDAVDEAWTAEASREAATTPEPASAATDADVNTAATMTAATDVMTTAAAMTATAAVMASAAAVMTSAAAMMTAAATATTACEGVRRQRRARESHRQYGGADNEHMSIILHSR